jgi:hypothetical protein
VRTGNYVSGTPRGGAAIQPPFATEGKRAVQYPIPDSGPATTDPATPESELICRRVAAVFDYAPTDDMVEQLHLHNKQIVEMILDDLCLEDLTPSEVLTLKALLAPAHARLLQLGEGGPPRLRVVN